MQLVQKIIEPLLQVENEILVPGKTVAIYPGRFQPFGPHHKKVFHHLQKKFGEVYIATSNKTNSSNSPLSFKEKKAHMIKMGIPSSKIVQVKNPYKAEEITDKLSDDTAVVFAFGDKDAGRISKGKYFLPYKGSVEHVWKERGYFTVAPHFGVNVAGLEVSGTTMRTILGSNKYAKNRKQNFKKLFGYWSPRMAEMFVDKFSISEYITKENIDNFLQNVNIKKIIESTNTQGGGVDDGPIYWSPSFASYAARGYGDAARIGYKVVDYILPKRFNKKFDKENRELYQYYPDGPQPSVSYMPAGVADPQIPAGHDLTGAPAWNRWKEAITRINKSLGWEFMNFVDKWRKDAIDQSKETLKQSEEEEADYMPQDRDDIMHSDYKKVVDITEEIKYLIPTKKEKRSLLLMGGAAGHMAHPFDDMSLTFGDLKKIINMGLGGNLSREEGVTEKLDGQNLMVSWKDDKLVAARNKGHLKNKGETSLDASALKAKFANRGAVTRAFSFAMDDLENAISGLSDRDKEKMFNNGGHFLNLEIIYPDTANVIDYDVAELIFHGIVKYDKNGTAKGSVRNGANKLSKMIDKINGKIQKRFKIGAPNFLNVPKHQNFGKLKAKFHKDVDKLRNQYGLQDNDTVSLYHEMYWREFVYNAAQQMGYDIPKSVEDGLVLRWAFFDKSFTIPMMKKQIDNEKFSEWAISTDKNDHKKMQKENMIPFELIFLRVGAEIMKNVEGYLSISPDKAVQRIRKDVESVRKQVESSKDPSLISKLDAQLNKLEALGGFDAVVPSEGLVFKYKGNTYKFTGAFAPVNQITGLLKYSR